MRANYISTTINNSEYTRRQWIRAIGAGFALAGFGGLYHAGKIEVAKNKIKEKLFTQNMEITSLWGKYTIMSIQTKDMKELIEKYGYHHRETKYVRNTEIAGRVIESKIGNEIRSRFPGRNDGELVNCLRNIIKRDIEYYELCGTHLTEGCAQELTESLTKNPKMSAKRIEAELNKQDNTFGVM